MTRHSSGRSLAVWLAAGLLAAAPAVAGAHELPVGDGHVTDHPARGNVFACETQFRGGGARHVGDWFHGDTWDPIAKPHVAGRVMWPQARFSMAPRGDALAVTGNGLPVAQPTGVFPIAPSDPVYQYDTNPNPIAEQALDFAIPAAPVTAASPGCLPMGMIGFTTTGVALFNALDAAGRDAAAHEVQDLCDGHPQGRGQYHYHSASPCMTGVDGAGLVGWALDGYPILGLRGADGRTLGNADLDDCHGRAETVEVEGRTYGYAYHLTPEYPYTLGCFTGQVREGTRQAIRQGLAPPRRRPGPPGG